MADSISQSSSSSASSCLCLLVTYFIYSFCCSRSSTNTVIEYRNRGGYNTSSDFSMSDISD